MDSQFMDRFSNVGMEKNQQPGVCFSFRDVWRIRMIIGEDFRVQYGEADGN